jgi:hypothetical protein
MSDLFPSVSLDPFQQSSQRFLLRCSETILLSPRAIVHFRRIFGLLPLFQVVGLLLHFVGLFVPAQLGQGLLLPAKLKKLL